MSILLLGRWNSELANLQRQQNGRNDGVNSRGIATINLENVLNGRRIKEVCLGVYHMVILTDQDEILIAGTSLPINDKTLQLVTFQDPMSDSNVYFPIYKFTSPLTLIESPQIACGPEFSIFTQSIMEYGKKKRHYLHLFGWDSKKVFDSRRNTARNTLPDILQGLLLKNVLTEEIPLSNDESISQIVCGGDFWMIIVNKRKILGKGYNRDGVLGLGHRNDCKKITVLPANELITNEDDVIEKICCGLHHAIFVVSTNDSTNSKKQIFTCGDNRVGQTAQGSKIKFQTKFSKCESLTQLIQSNGLRDVSCEYQSTWLLTLNNRLFACGLLTSPESILQRVFEPIEFKVPYSSSLLSNGISPKAPFHFGCGGYHSVFSNHRCDSIVGIGANTCEQLLPHPSVLDLNSNGERKGNLTSILQYNDRSKYCKENSLVKKILCSRDCSMIIMESLPPIKGLDEFLNNFSILFDISIVSHEE